MLRQDIIDLLEKHTQSARNRRCSCGWRPSSLAKDGSESMQHRNHVADAITSYLSEWYE